MPSHPPWRSRAARLLPAAAFAVYVLYASVVDPASMGGAADAVTGTLASTDPVEQFGLDKWLHAATYGTLAFLVAAGLPARNDRQLALVVLAAVAFGAGIEVVQAPLAARSFEVADVAANAVGAVAGAGAWVLVWTVVTLARPSRVGDVDWS